jgi:Tfp pilus assembly protein PilF
MPFQRQGAVMGDRPGHVQPSDTPERHERQPNRSAQEDPSSAPAGPRGESVEDPHVFCHRAIQALQRGEFEQALQSFTRTLELDRTFVPAWVGQVRMFIELGELRKACQWVEKALELFKNDADLLSVRAVLQTRRGETQEALASSDAALRAPGSGAYRWLARAEVMLSADPDQVAASFQRALEAPDADGFTHLWIARIHRRYRRYTDALIAARQATQALPQAPFAWYVRGLCERDLAIRAWRASLERALQLDPTYALAQKALCTPPNASWLVRLFRRIRRA